MSSYAPPLAHRRPRTKRVSLRPWTWHVRRRRHHQVSILAIPHAADIHPTG